MEETSTQEIIIDNSKLNFTLKDYITLDLLKEEGRFLKILYDMELSSIDSIHFFILSIAPYIALIDVECRTYLNERVGANFPLETDRVHQLRHRFKYLNDRSSVVTYCDQAKETLHNQKQYWSIINGQTGSSGDMRVFYVSGEPIGSSLMAASVLRNEVGANPDLLGEKTNVGSFGTELGNTVASFLKSFSELYISNFNYKVPSVTSSQYSIDALIQPTLSLNEEHPSEGIYLLLLDVALSLNCILALEQHNVMRGLLLTKLLLVVQFHAISSISKYIDQSYGKSQDSIPVSVEMREQLVGLLSNDARKTIMSLKSLRNDFVHYFILNLSFPRISINKQTKINTKKRYFKERTNMSTKDLDCMLRRSAKDLSRDILKMIQFPGGMQ